MNQKESNKRERRSHPVIEKMRVLGAGHETETLGLWEDYLSGQFSHNIASVSPTLVHIATLFTRRKFRCRK